MLKLKVPSSKSLTQRALFIASLIDGVSELLNPSDCDDTRHMKKALVQLGCVVEERGQAWIVRGGHLKPGGESLWLGNSGTATRFLMALSLLLDGSFYLSGNRYLHKRPIGEIVLSLRDFGVEVDFLENDDCLPVLITCKRSVNACNSLLVDASKSSQFLSGVLMVAPCLPGGINVRVEGPVVSKSYIRMTIQLMRHFGVECIVPAKGEKIFAVPQAGYRTTRFAVEGDWSSASVLLVASRISGRNIEITNLSDKSVQGDRRIVDFLHQLDENSTNSFNLVDCPDLVAALSVAAALTAKGPTRINGIAHARIKECDRIDTLCRAFTQVGIRVEQHSDGMTVFPAQRIRPALLDCCKDHRMAMAFGLLALKQPGIRVNDPVSVNKSFPSFWSVLSNFATEPLSLLENI